MYNNIYVRARTELSGELKQASAKGGRFPRRPRLRFAHGPVARRARFAMRFRAPAARLPLAARLPRAAVAREPRMPVA